MLRGVAGDRGQAGLAGVRVVERAAACLDAAFGRVAMRVLEAWKDGPALELEDSRLGVNMVTGPRGRADPGDAPVSDGDGLGECQRGIGREDAAFGEYEIHAVLGPDAGSEVPGPRTGRNPQLRVRRSAIGNRDRTARVEPAALRYRDGFGVSPWRICGWTVARGSRWGTTEMRAFVYGCFGSVTTSRADPSSTIRPRYMTAIRSAKWAAVERSCVIMRIPSPLRRSSSRRAEDAGADGNVEHRDRLVGDEGVAG